MPMMPVRLVELLHERDVVVVEVPDHELESQGPNVLALGPRVALARGNPETRRRMERGGRRAYVRRRRDLAEGRRRADLSSRPLDRA